VIASRGDDGRLGIVYIPRGSQLLLDRRFIPESGGGEWFDPRTGERQPATIPADGAVETPDGEDWVLLLEGLP
jgi:hypothetical protein